jgi:hypothetical protein
MERFADEAVTFKEQKKYNKPKEPDSEVIS